MSKIDEKIMIASDIHGSAHWCEKLVAACEREKAREASAARGSPLSRTEKRTARRVRAQKGGGTPPIRLKKKSSACAELRRRSGQMMLEFPVMADYALLFAAGKVLYATHGHLFDADNPPPLSAGEILLNGHFHVPCHKEIKGGVLYANCGSVALPKNDTPHSYLLLENDELLWKDLGDECKVFDRLKL